VLLEDFDFDLPSSAIALRPASPRDAARLLIVGWGAAQPFSESAIRDLPGMLVPGDVMVFNNTKVIPAELAGERASRGSDAGPVAVSLTLIERLAGGRWKAMARPARRLREGDEIVLYPSKSALCVHAKGESGDVIVGALGAETIEEIMEAAGSMPLPPYIAKSRAADERDRTDYQTVYAKKAGAVAAPTAGLHFTPELLAALASAGIKTAFVTLHVGAGTFLPVRNEHIESHRLHPEWAEISEEAARTINEGREKGGRLIAVGTTSLRLLETAARDDGRIEPYSGNTSLFIKPGHRFRSANLLLTNFHLPKSTLFMLVCAFSGSGLMKKAYAHAIKAGFRFYSYGDACLLHRASESSPT
jgi:S-adenosylmethionine:tRNA ribosyltransferase-isomerase